jgi:hypothetical protein
MKRSITAIAAIAAVLFTGSATAGHVYGKFAAGDPDLYGYGGHESGVTAMQPGVGQSGVNIYDDFGQRNGDLFPPEDRGGSAVADPDRRSPRIYKGFTGADLTW